MLDFFPPTMVVSSTGGKRPGQSEFPPSSLRDEGGAQHVLVPNAGQRDLLEAFIWGL